MTHIVIADPDQSIRKLLKQIVSLLSWTCDMAASGLEAWQLVEKAQPELVIAEVELSQINGIELVWMMKHHPSLSHIPVILMGSPHREEAALTAGGAAFVAKPFYVETLLQILPQLITAEPLK